MTRLMREKFLALLVSLVLLLAAYPLLAETPAGRLVFCTLLTAVFVAALPVVFTDRPLRLLAGVLAVPTVTWAWIRYFLPVQPAPPLAVGLHLTAALFLALTVTAILRAVSRRETVSADAIYGAFCGYLLVGVAFSHVYAAIDAVSPTAFEEKVSPAARRRDDERRHFTLLYFSLITLTTVGYGDVTPATAPARGLAVIEAVLGQFYLAVLIAQLIGKWVSQPSPGRGPGPAG
jgi:hypothetical protein